MTRTTSFASPWLLVALIAFRLFTAVPVLATGGVGAGRAGDPDPPGGCAGDCDHNAAVGIAELVSMVAIALEAEPLSACGAGDTSGDGAVTVDEILLAVKRALEGCIQSGTLIRLNDGFLQGAIAGGTRRFLGIPFAAPPVGERRWRPPAPVSRWDGVRDATQFGPACAQRASMFSMPSDAEDCLYLNVWTPDPAPAEPVPVMVWLHGGSNRAGSAGDPAPFGQPGLTFDGRTLCETRDVIIVTTNYRLGVLGFFAHSSLAAEDPTYPYSGNQGLLDQRAALQWVRNNILAFGGDPNNVTIFGQSAGGFDVCAHLVSPGSRGLFQRAISESPATPIESGGMRARACSGRLQSAPEAEADAERVIAATGCTGAGDLLACLRSVAPADLLQAAGDAFNPIVEGSVLADQPRRLLDAGDFARVPYILGTNVDEGALLFLLKPPVTSDEAYRAALRERYGDDADAVAALYPPAEFSSPQSALNRAAGDSEFVCTTYDAARHAAAKGADVYLYNFARSNATHGSEVMYIFPWAQLDPIDDALARALHGYWTRLARDGDPNGEGAVVWPRYDDATDQRLNLDAEITVLTAFRRAECEFWWEVYDREFE